MTDQQQPTPLWEAMYDAYWDGSDEEAHQPGTDAYEQSLRSGFAAEIEALADWLVPEPEEPLFTATDEAFAIWEERKAVRQILLDEARRAREAT